MSKTIEIPADYDGVMGVPITFLDKYNPEQFEILGLAASAGYNAEIVGIPFLGNRDARAILFLKMYMHNFYKEKNMKIELHEITVGEIYNGYADSGENGVVGYGGKLNIRPKYQREFVYDDKKRNAVIDTINRGFPLNVMYWAVNEDGTYEILTDSNAR